MTDDWSKVADVASTSTLQTFTDKVIGQKAGWGHFKTSERRSAIRLAVEVLDGLKDMELIMKDLKKREEFVLSRLDRLSITSDDLDAYRKELEEKKERARKQELIQKQRKVVVQPDLRTEHSVVDQIYSAEVSETVMPLINPESGVQEDPLNPPDLFEPPRKRSGKRPELETLKEKKARIQRESRSMEQETLKATEVLESLQSEEPETVEYEYTEDMPEISAAETAQLLANVHSYAKQSEPKGIDVVTGQDVDERQETHVDEGVVRARTVITSQEQIPQLPRLTEVSDLLSPHVQSFLSQAPLQQEVYEGLIVKDVDKFLQAQQEDEDIEIQVLEEEDDDKNEDEDVVIVDKDSETFATKKDVQEKDIPYVHGPKTKKTEKVKKKYEKPKGRSVGDGPVPLNMREAGKFYCDSCPRKFSYRYGLLEHKRQRCNKPQEKRFKCPECDKTYEKKGSCKQHYFKYHLQKPLFVCQVCNKEFSLTKEYYAHKKVCSSEDET